MSAQLVQHKVVNTIFIFLVLTLFAMTATYIIRIRAKLAFLIRENFNLLNSMEEGLIISSRNHYGKNFATEPALSIF